MPAEVNLKFLAGQMVRVLSDIAEMRDAMDVNTAILMRLDGTLGALVGEMRATHKQIARINNRIRKLEDANEER